MVGKWSADHLPSTYCPPTDHQISFKDPSKAPSTQVFFIMHFNKCCCCLLCDHSNRCALNSYFHKLQCTDHLPSTYRPLPDHIPTTSQPLFYSAACSILLCIYTPRYSQGFLVSHYSESNSCTSKPEKYSNQTTKYELRFFIFISNLLENATDLLLNLLLVT